MKRICLSFFAIGITLGLKAGNENFLLGARSAAMGNASVTFSDVWSANQNQAGLAFLKDVSAGVYYENRFMVKELGLKAGAIAVPVKGGTFGVCVSNFGFTSYSENKYSVSFAKAFGHVFSMAVAMDYLSTKIGEGYGSKGQFVAEVGVQAKPLKGLTLGAHVFNPNHAKLVDYNNERIPTIIRLGANYNFSDKVMIALENEKDISQKSIFKAGIEYKVVKELYLRAGICTNPSLSSYGFGLNLQNLRIDVSASYHQVLGISPQFGLLYQFKSKTKAKSKSKTETSEEDEQ
jgi:hypothetical protein